MRISLDHVKFSNILLFGNSPQEVDLLPGMNVIVGKFPGKTNSNRAGKTSFTDVLSFALYGRVLKSLRQDQIINWRNKKNCLAEISFTKGQEKFSIKRGLKPNRIEVYHNGQPVPFTGARDIQRQIEEDILGISYNTFVNLVYTNINYSVPILKMKSTQKRAFIEGLFNLEMFSKLSAGCINKLNSIDKKVDSLCSKIKINQAVSQEHQRQIKELTAHLDTNNELVSRLGRIERQVKNIKSVDIDDVRQKLSRTREVLIKLNDIKGKINTKLGIYKEKEKNLRDASASQGNIEGQYHRASKKIKDFSKMISDHKTTEDLTIDIDKCKEKIQILQERINTLNNHIVSDTSLRDAKLKDLEILKDKSTCPVCRRDIDDYMVFTIIENEISAFNDNCKSYMAEMTLLNAQIEDQNKRKTLLVEEKNAVIDLKKQLKNAEEQLKNIELLRTSGNRNIGTKIVKYYNVNSKLSNVLQNHMNMIEKQKDLVDLYEKEINSYNEYKEIIEERDRLIYQIDYNNSQKEHSTNKIRELQEHLDSLSIENSKLEQEISKIHKLYDYIAFIKDVCKDDNIKQYAISSMIPYLTKKTNEYLAAIGYNFYVEFDRWVDCTIKGPGIYNGSYSSLSGGESRSVDIALMMAFHDIARLSSPNYFDIMVLDELLDSSVDSSSIGGVVDIIKAKQAQDNLKVFMITHRQEISDIEFDNIYEVERISGFSRVRIK
jgi:DNA repair exonuclease SbcCD ATPase subunit